MVRRYIAALSLMFIGSLATLGWMDWRVAPSAHAAPTNETAATDSAPTETKLTKEEKRQRDDENYELYRALADTIDQVERNYVKKVDRRELMEAAIKGVVSKLDPYSSYISPDELGGFKTTVESQFGGIGIQVSVDDGHLKVISPMVGTPAYRAGIQSGDRIMKISGEPTGNITIDDAIRKLKGEVGTSVTMTIVHAGGSKLEDVTVKREIIHVDTVMGDHRKDDDSWNYMLDADKRSATSASAPSAARRPTNCAKPCKRSKLKTSRDWCWTCALIRADY